jgi:formiminoglutamase
LGGGHEIAFGNYNGIINHLQELKSKPSLGIINFDAHIDLRPYKDKGSSGTMFYQIAEKCNKEELEFNYLCIGTQTYSNTISLFNRAKELGANYINAKDIVEQNYLSISKQIKRFVNKSEHIYITICSDVFSSAFAPGVSAPQPFGLSPETVVGFVKEIIETNKVISFDIAEVSPRFDNDNQTSKLAAVIIYAAVNVYVENNK